MSLFDALMGNVPRDAELEQLAAKLGLPSDQVAQAVRALGAAYVEPGNTIETAAVGTGLSSNVLNEIIGHIGGEGSLAQFSKLGGDGGVSVSGNINISGRSLGIEPVDPWPEPGKSAR